jgi:golgi phosphoprotein 3
VLTLLEEVVLLTIDPRTGCLRGDQQFSVPYALTGAALFDLALAGRIDTDVDAIEVIDRTPTGNPLQDELLAELAAGAEAMSVRGWVEQTFRLHKDLEDRALSELVERGLIRQEKTRRLWVIEVQRFPLVDGKPQQQVKERLAEAILGDAIPATRDIMLVSLVAACGLLNLVLTPEQQDARARRIETLSTLETISRNVSSAIAGLYEDMARGLSGV